MRYLPEDNLNYPVFVETEKGNGSGFYLNFKDTSIYLVTAYHVLFDPKTKEMRGNSLRLTSYDFSDRQKELIFEVDLTAAKVISDPTRDVAIVLLADVPKLGVVGWKSWVRRDQESGKATIVTVSFGGLKKFDAVLESNEVFILSYPSSLGLSGQIEQRRPLLRKGIIAGKNYTNKTLIIDCPVYFGNSGGLAIEVEETSPTEKKFSIIGVVIQYIPFIEHLYSLEMSYVNVNMENSGYAVVTPADVIEEIIKND